MRAVIFLLVVLLAASIGWRYRAVFADWLQPEPPPKPFVWDNGSVRDTPPASAPAPVQATAPPVGAMRKCVKGSETTYTNFSCPPGFKEAAIKNDRVTVVAGTPVPKPEGAKQGEATSALHEALDLKRDDELKRRVMERAMNGAER